jgi:hypothetical protein
MQEAVESPACFVSPAWRREVLEVDDQCVGTGVLHSIVRESIGARTEQPGSSQIRFR